LPSFLDAGIQAERLGYDHLWTWDHLYAIFGDPNQPVFEGYTALAALAQATERIRLGLFVGANTFRNPGLATKSTGSGAAPRHPARPAGQGRRSRRSESLAVPRRRG
jgi:alkanesulfonate monooxygenase SsuD/methylene tetrahydromethanopterin reductase-like flavin-dependent oxidoreductase (luciferase family)